MFMFYLFKASLGCSCGDTLASELGSVIGGGKKNAVFHVIEMKMVPKGANGGVSLVGTLGKCIFSSFTF